MLTSDLFNKPVEENCKYGRYYCTTDKKYKCRQGPKQTRASESVEQGVAEEANPIDTVEMDVPLLIRALEYAREDAKDDMDLHKVVERMLVAAQNGEPLNMDDYNMIFGDQQENPKEVDEAKRKKKPKSKPSLMSKPAKRKYGGYYYPGYGYYGDGGDSGGGDGGGGGESRINEKKDKTKLSTLDLRSELDSHATTLLNIAKRKYPMAKSDLAALIKLLDRVQLHSIEKDTAHDKDIKAIRRDVAALEKRVNELYKKQKVKESRLYYSVAGTLNESLRKDFKMRKDRKGWFLPESASVKQKLDAERAFGEPIAEMNLLRPIKMKGPKNPVAVNQNGNKYKNPAKLIKFGK